MPRFASKHNKSKIQVVGFHHSREDNIGAWSISHNCLIRQSMVGPSNPTLNWPWWWGPLGGPHKVTIPFNISLGKKKQIAFIERLKKTVWKVKCQGWQDKASAEKNWICYLYSRRKLQGRFQKGSPRSSEIPHLLDPLYFIFF